MLYYVIALALYAEASTQEVLRCVVEGARWLGDPTTTDLPSMPMRLHGSRSTGNAHRSTDS